MDDFMLTAATLKLGYALLAVVAAIGVSRWLDRRAKIDFSQIVQEIRRDELAASFYFGVRFLAICLLVGFVIS